MAKKITKKPEEDEEEDLPIEKDLDNQTNLDDDEFETSLVEPEDFIILDDFEDDDDDDDDDY